MRVIAGSARGRVLQHPKGLKIRPTSDRVKEALFNIIAVRTRGAIALDLFAGTGALGIEALSRGAERVVFIDQHQYSIKLIRRNLELTGLLSQAEIYKKDAGQALSLLQRKGRTFDLIFLDPPYREGIALLTLRQLAGYRMLRTEGIVAVEHSCREELPERIADLQVWRQRNYGDTELTFYVREGAEQYI